MVDLSVFYKDGISSDQVKVKTLCYLRRINTRGQTEYLLAKHYKQHKWNGFGGKVGDKPEFKDETVDEGLIREGREELGITVINPIKRALILFIFYDEEGNENRVLVHVFFADKYEGEIKPSKEMKTPTWFTFESMPWDEMWPNDRLWLEKLLTNDKFLEAEFRFDSKKGLIVDKVKMVWREKQLSFVILRSVLYGIGFYL